METLPDEIDLHLLAVDFKNTDYGENCNCAVSKAAKRQLDVVEAEESVYGLTLNDEYYKHDCYHFGLFVEDMDKAASNSFDTSLIRTLKLIKA